MSNIHLDNVMFSTLHEAYKNHNTQYAVVETSGPVGVGVYREFTTDLTLSRSGTRADIFYEVEFESVMFAGKILLNGSSRILGGFPGDADTIAYPVIRYTGNILTVGVALVNNIFIFNSEYTYHLTVVEYDAPITPT